MDKRDSFLAFVAIFARAYLEHLAARQEDSRLQDQKRGIPPTIRSAPPLLTTWTCLESARLKADEERKGYYDPETFARGHVLEHFRPLAQHHGFFDF